MNNEKVKYAVVGLGVGMTHADAAHALDITELAAVCDIDRDRLAKAGERFPEAKLYESFDPVLEDPEIDAVSICVPSGMHADFAIRALNAGKHVLIEKPVDISLSAARRIEETRLLCGKKAGVVFQNRNNFCMKPMLEAVRSGRLGKIALGTFAVKWYRDDAYYKHGGWRGTWGVDGGGSLINQSSHTVDLMLMLMGEVESVSSRAAVVGHDIEAEDTTVSVIKFKSGALGTFTSTTCAYPGISTEIGVYGTDGSIEADADRLKLWQPRDADDGEEDEMLAVYGAGNGAYSRRHGGAVFGHESVVLDMARAILSGGDPAVGITEAMKSLRVVRAIYDSAKTGETVYLS